MLDRLGVSGADAAGWRGRCAASCPPRRPWPRSSPGSSRPCARAATPRWPSTSGASAAPRRRCACRATSCAAALDALDPAVRAGLEQAGANVGRVAAAGLRADSDVELPAGPAGPLARDPGPRVPPSTRPAAASPYPSSVIMGAVTAARGRRRGGRGRRPGASGHPRRLRALRRRRGLPHGRRAGDRRARAAGRRRSGRST